jgi:hypothetical protein
MDKETGNGRCVVWIKLVIRGDAADAAHVVGKVLDGGTLQDAINTHDRDTALVVVSAVVK